MENYLKYVEEKLKKKINIEEIEIIVLDEQFVSTKAKVNQEIVSNQINLEFRIEELDKYTVERINIFGNNITRESVIRNNLSIDEGDVINELLTKKSENNIKSLNIFRDVQTKIIENENSKSKTSVLSGRYWKLIIASLNQKILN